MVKISAKINGVETLVDASKLEKLENGLFANNYNEDYTIDIDSENTEQAQNELQTKLAEAQSYLTSTDWYFARLADTGEKVPEEVKVKRAEARTFIQENK